MSEENLKETTEYTAGIYQLKTNDLAEGGENGVLNTPLRQLANRTAFLKKRTEEVEAKIPGTESFERIYQQIAGLDVSKIEKRTDHLERITGDLMLVLDANLMYPDADAILVENFDDPDKVDLTEVQVTSVISGDDSIDVVDSTNLVIGANYILTDGENQEEAQIKSINVSGTTHRIVFETPVINQYDANRTKMHRSSIAVYNGRAYGGGSIKTDTYAPGIDWKGSTTSQDVTAAAGAFTNESDYELTGVVFSNGKAVLGGQAVGIVLVKTGGGAGTWAQVNAEGDNLQ